MSERRSPLAHQLWLHGWDPEPGAARSLRLFDPWGARVVALDMKVSRDGGIDKVIECAVDGQRVCYIVLAAKLSQGMMVRHEGGDIVGYGRR
jgi:hypothetical protein